MGIDNAGAQIVRPDVLHEELINSPELTRKFASGTYSNEKMYTVRDNKLCGILDNSEFNTFGNPVSYKSFSISIHETELRGRNVFYIKILIVH